MLSRKLSHRAKKKYRLIASIILALTIFFLLRYFIPLTQGEASPQKVQIKNVLFAIIFGFLPFYILPWLKWIMGHDNDLEENMDGDPKGKE
ncbi:MAG: hypothetical protein ABI844_17320 [Saprospiraceae bacterium]